ncbi:MAG: chromate transporter [Rhodocyclaceae bacterium]|nr:MAG: chromate transporter [Rhodocyclaceae bacterium]TND01683.1 MAG: chromate transporter [Rhodocyclaceae bacterium]
MSSFGASWREVASVFLKIGAMAYGGPAIMGIMQAELQEKRRWVDKERFLEGLALVNLLPGAGATQLGIFLGYARGGWWGGLLAGLCFVLPALFIMLALTAAYAALGSTPFMRGALYGLGPVVLGIYAVAVFRLGKSAITGAPQVLIAVAAALVTAAGPLGLVTVLALAGGIGILLFASRRQGLAVLAAIALMVALMHYVGGTPTLALEAKVGAGDTPAGLFDIGVFFFKVGAFTFGGGLTMIAFVQEQVVNQFHWLTPREFVDGLALGQFTPGPILMVAAYVGFKLAGIAGALVAAAAIFLPSFILMLSLLPIFERVRKIAWMKAAMRGIGPAVIGVLAVSLAQLAPHAAPDLFAASVFVATVLILLVWRVGAIKLMLGGALLGTLRDRLA